MTQERKDFLIDNLKVFFINNKNITDQDIFDIYNIWSTYENIKVKDEEISDILYYMKEFKKILNSK